MAGDWIKVEHATAKKPEVMKMARMLGINRREMVGTLLDFFVWCDINAVDGVVDGCVDADVDDLMSCPGFSAVMREVGWLRFERDPPRMLIPNWERHSGETSKKRALKNDRQARWRANTVDAPPSTKASTREEKRRVNTSLRSVLDAPSEEHRALAKSLNVDCDEQFQRYRDHFAANGKPHKDQEAGFRNWLRRAKDFKPRVLQGGADARAAVAASIWGTDAQRPDAIDGTAERIA